MVIETEASFHSALPEVENEADDTTPEELTPAAPPGPTPPTLPNSPASEQTIEENDIISEQFANYLLIAQALLKTLRRPKDIEICTNLLEKLKLHNDSHNSEVKRNNNQFFQYCLKVIKWTSENQPLELYQCWYHNRETAEKLAESYTWSEDKKSFMAVKRLKDGTNIIYSAISGDPSTGWQEGGLNILAKRGVSSRN